MIGASPMIHGCALLVGKAVYDSGESTRLYNATFDKTIRTCHATLEYMNFGPSETIPGGIKSAIRSQWYDGTPLTVEITMKAVRLTEVSVRCGVIGVRDKTISEMILDDLQHRLSE
jgi:hypothetical protein